MAFTLGKTASMEDVAWALDEWCRRTETLWLSDPPADDDVFHLCASLPTLQFVRGLDRAWPHLRGRRFLDVGCGAGHKLALAAILGMGPVFGIERHAPYAALARRLAQCPDVVVADAFDVQRFDADLVYAYRLCVADELEDRLEHHIAERVQPGTVLFFPQGHVDLSDVLEPLGTDLWRRA